MKKRRSKKECPKDKSECPQRVGKLCSCFLGRLSRNIEPILLFLIHKSPSHGYELIQEANKYSIMESLIDPGAVYRVLRQLEEGEYVSSEWDMSNPGPAKRKYVLTETGKELLDRWILVLEKQLDILKKLTDEYREVEREGS